MHLPSLKFDVFLLVFIFFITTYISIGLGVILFISIVLFRKQITLPYFFYIIYLFALIAFTQYSTYKQGDYDIIRYYATYSIFSELNFTQVLPFFIIQGDVFFYFLVFLLTRIFPNDPRMLSFFFVVATSVFNLFAARNIGYLINGKSYYYTKKQLLFWFISFFLIISFPLFTNIFRQFFAMSLLFYGFSRKSLGKSYWLFIILAILSHWSMLIYVLLFLFLYKFRDREEIILAFAPLLSILFNFILPLIPFFKDKIQAYAMGEEILGVDKTLIAIVIFIQLALYVYLRSLKKIFKDWYLLLLIMLVFSCIFIFNSTIITRHYYFLSAYIAVLFTFSTSVSMVRNTLQNKLRKNILILLIILPLSTYIVWQMRVSSFKYDFFSENLLTTSGMSILTSNFPFEMIK